MTSSTPPAKPTSPRRAALAMLLVPLAGFGLLAAAPGAARAAEPAVQLEGQTFDRRVQLGGVSLLLNGVGLRAVAWLKAYAAGLYLTSRTGDPVLAIGSPGPKRVQLRMLQEAAADEFVKAFERGTRRNAAPDELAALGERMQRFGRQVLSIGKVRKGDVIDLDFVPGRGTSLSLNGRDVGSPIAGDDFYALLLKMFIGEKVSDPELRAGLLGRST